MDKQILNDPDIEPSEANLEQAFGAVYPVFREFIETIESPEYGLASEWRFYKDAKAWLCKITRGKKTVVWLSAWSGFFRLGFYFTEKTGAGIAALDISDDLKSSYASNKPVGRLRPLVVDLREKAGLGDALSLIDYKSNIR